MIKRLKKHYEDGYIYDILDEDVALWFKHNYRSFTPPQKYAIPNIANKKNILISSPTGSGKTLSAFLAIIDELIKLEKQKKLENRVYALYISPLRALNNDMEKNLINILEGLRVYYPHNINVGIWTSDTTQNVKNKLKKKPPHILITTPESLLLMLSSSMRENLINLDWVVVDEIHELADNKRGVSLSLSLERLSYYKEYARIGLSATVAPLEEVAKYLVGNSRECYIADVSYSKYYDIKVETVADDFIRDDPEEVEKKLVKYLKDIILREKAILVFTNTRRAAEAVGYTIKKEIGDDSKYIGIHHSSLSRAERLNVEKMMKEGKFKAVFSSASLELGIDIGKISLVVLLSSPKSAARALQRIGRAGHNLNEVSRGLFLTSDLDVFIEDLMINRMIYLRRFDTVNIPKNSLDVLTQHILSVGYQENHDLETFYKIIIKSYPYSELSYQDYLDLIDLLAKGYKDIITPKIDLENNKIKTKYPKMFFLMNAGVIPDEVKIPVYDQESKLIGYLDEKYAREISIGDIFVLGGKQYKMVGTYGEAIVVIEYDKAKPNVPSWVSEALPLGYEIALELERFRGRALNMSEEEIAEFLGINNKYAKQIKDYIKFQHLYTGVVPDDKNILIESWIDREGNIAKRSRVYAFHYLAGRRANEAISKAYLSYIKSNITDDVEVMISDYGFVMFYNYNHELTEQDIKNLLSLTPQEFLKSIKDIVYHTQRFTLKFKDVLVRMFAIRRDSGISILNIANRIKTEYVGNDLNSPFVKEAYNEILNMDFRIEHALDYIKRLKDRKLHLVEVANPSPFAANIIFSSNIGDRLEVGDKKEYLLKFISNLNNYG